MSEFATVYCHVGNGLLLRTYDKVEGPMGLVSHFEKDRFELKPGANQVPVAFIDEWMEANSDSDFVKRKLIERNKE